MKKFIALIFVFMFLLSVTFGIDIPDVIYSVQIGSYPTISEAEAQRGIIEQAGYSPIKVVNLNDKYKVRFGDFFFYMDAYLYKEDIRKNLVQDAFIVSYQNRDNLTVLPDSTAPISKIFNLREGNINQLPEVQLKLEDPTVIRITNFLKSQMSNEELKKQIQEAMNNREDNDSIKGWLTMRLAYINLRLGNKYISKTLFKNVAEGSPIATANERVEAMLMVGKLYHSEKDRIIAYRNFKEVLKYAKKTDDKTEALLQLASLILELARSGKGTLSEARFACIKVMENTPEENILFRALAEQMHLEAWYYEGNQQKCIEEAEPYLQKYPDSVNREKAMCKTFLGISYYKIGKYEKAVETLSSILNMNIQMKWKNADSKKDTLDFLIIIAKEKNDIERLTQWEDLKQQLYGQ